MKRVLVLLAGAVFASAARADDGGWSSLWQTADQRGQRLLDQGKPAEAAKVYADPRRRANAELSAGDYAAAAKDLGAFDDGDGHYNRGNALAHAGDLKGALAAYDAALKHDPNSADAKRNRDLVAKALDQQQQQQQEKKQDGKKGDQKQDPKSGDKGDPKQPPSSGQSSQDGKPGESSRQPQDPSAGKPGEPPQPGKDQQEAGAGSGGGDAQQQPPKDPAPPPVPGQAAQPGQSGADQEAAASGSDEAQARKDAKAALDKSADGKPGLDADKTAHPPQDAQAEAPTPTSENQLATDQWLRRIPDDPGGLLRRKFMIEHLLKQKQQQQQQDPEPP